ncbi:hypothetical protein CAMSH0001_1785 [Campylobacter showae RM3277]|uniref:Uncharacterized protein n=1 Tax=Campylobacter showae RM3277 TaxID=553219 RepID=C6RD69_9BACT|nr:hypothetical protein CAMSH0001_1785 [Campylobacter showae RM3277]
MVSKFKLKRACFGFGGYRSSLKFNVSFAINPLTYTSQIY